MAADIHNVIKYKLKWRLKKIKHKYFNPFDKYYQQNKITPDKYSQRILDDGNANRLIYERLMDGKPLMISRIGSGELRCLLNWQIGKKFPFIDTWHENVKHQMFNYGGIFPRTNKMLTRFSKEFIRHIRNIDLLGVWYNPGEEKIVEHHCPNAALVSLAALEPYIHQEPWSKALTDKKVLVVHPFSQSIENQYKKRDFLFENKDVLPLFNLITYKTVMSIPGEKLEYKNWLTALYHMRDEIRKIDFDIAIIGAGPYGLPLASYIKNMGKQAIHLGGATQILFGIKGKRWEEMERFNLFFNEHWVRPSKEETPKEKNRLEEGCYW